MNRIGMRSILLVIPAAILNAETLQPETLKAWNEYVTAAHSRLLTRLNSAGQRDWIDRDRDRTSKLHQGEIWVAPIGAPNPKRVPSGLIHDWIAAAFIPAVKIDDVFAFVRDYSLYKDFYKPVVIGSKLLDRAGEKDEYSMLLLDRALLSHAALDADFESSYRQLDSRRWYSIAHTTRVQEIENYGEPDERKLPADQGNGYVWRLCSMVIFEERDGGVYIEIEAIGLSRDIPSSLRWVVDPLVRRISKRSIVAFLQETREGVQWTLDAKKPPCGAVPCLPTGD